MKKVEKETILLVDDEPACRTMLKNILEIEGYNVLDIPDGQTAIDWASRIRTHLILLDILMPDIDGYTVCQTLKSQPGTREIPVIFMSALADPFNKVKGFDQGAVDYITKPIETTELLARVKTQLTLRRLQAQLQDMNAALEQKVSERTEALTRANRALNEEVEERKRTEEALIRSERQLRALTERLAEADEASRKLLARELHDRVGQNLAAINLNLNIIDRLLSKESADRVKERLKDTIRLEEETAERIRDVMADLRPYILDDYGLLPALRWEADRFMARTGVRIDVTGDEISKRPSHPLEIALFRVAQEALANVMKHASAKMVSISLKENAGILKLTIEDNGIGFDAGKVRQTVSSGWGLITMKERIQSLSGRLEVYSKSGKGTKIVVEIDRSRPIVKKLDQQYQTFPTDMSWKV